VTLVRDGLGVVATLKEVADETVVTVEPLRVAAVEAVHRAPELLDVGVDDEVDVVGHEAVRENCPVRDVGGDEVDEIQECQRVCLGQEERKLANRPRRHMSQPTRELSTCTSSHTVDGTHQCERFGNPSQNWSEVGADSFGDCPGDSPRARAAARDG
jgi:hypothetical protein